MSTPFTLTAQEFGASIAVPRRLAYDLPGGEVSTYLEDALDHLVVRLKRDVWTEQLAPEVVHDSVEVEVPALHTRVVRLERPATRWQYLRAMLGLEHRSVAAWYTDREQQVMTHVEVPVTLTVRRSLAYPDLQLQRPPSFGRSVRWESWGVEAVQES